jgi:hypothetical protein
LVEGTSLGSRRASVLTSQGGEAALEAFITAVDALTAVPLDEATPDAWQALLNGILEQGLSFQNKRRLALALARLGGGIQDLQLPADARADLIELMVGLAESEGATAASACCALCFLCDNPDLLSGDEKADNPSVLKKCIAVLAECAGLLPPEFCGDFIGQVGDLFYGAFDNPNPNITPAAFGALCALGARAGNFDPVLGAFRALCEKTGDPSVLKKCIAVFVECAGHLPQENYDALIVQVGDLFYGALGNPNPHIAPAAFGALCALCAKAGNSGAALDAFGALCALGARADNPDAAATLVACARLVPRDFPNYGDLINQVRGLFSWALDSDPAIAPAAFGALCALCEEAADPNIAAILVECAGHLPQENYDALIGQVNWLFYGALDSDPPVLPIIPAAFGALCALCERAADHDFRTALDAFGAAVGALEGQAQALRDSLAGDEEAHDAAWQAFGEFAAILGECIGHVPNEFCGEFIGAIRGRFDAAAGTMRDSRDIGNRFAGMRIAHELLKFWSMLQVRGVAERSRDAVLGQVVKALNQSGRRYFSCRGDAEWRRMHTADSAVLAILARTDLALVTGEIVELSGKATALATALGRSATTGGLRTCDAYTEVLCTALGRMQNVMARVIAEMQQKKHETGGRDNLLARIGEYIRLAEAQLGERNVFGIGYQGYGTRGTLVREGNAATLAIGAPMVAGEGQEARQLIEGRIRGFRDAIADRLRARLPADAVRSVVDVVTVIGTSHVLTFEIVENLSLHPDARALCNFLQITEEHMEARLQDNDGQASVLLGEGFMRLPEGAQVGGAGSAEFWDSSKLLMGDMVQISEGLLRQLTAAEGRVAALEDEVAAAEEQGAVYRQRLGTLSPDTQRKLREKFPSPTGSSSDSPGSPGSPGTPRVELRRQRDAAEGRVAALEDEVAAERERATAAEGQVAELRAQLAALQAQQPQVQAGDVPLPENDDDFLA